MTMSTTSLSGTTVLHTADTRGHADHGWLNAWHSFSFANWHDPERMHFGALRVLNDDTIAAGKGFGTHPHDNMEIITIVTEGALKHTDSMGNEGIIKAGDVQVMSAGTGVRHSEFNPDPAHRAKLFQIWLFPRKRGATPRYDQITLDPKDRKDRFQQIVSPDPADAGTWIGQDAWFQLGKFDSGRTERYRVKRKGNGVYALVVSGSAEVQGQRLSTRDALGVSGVEELDIRIGSEGAELLLIDVPMEFN
jgi:redox-sensitive bicupin YhaK (pirin superfamily)